MTQDSPAAPQADRRAALSETVLRVLGEGAVKLDSRPGELACEVPAARLLEAAAALRDDPALKFEMCMDVCGVDYLEYGRAEWKTAEATSSGFSRGVSDDLLPAGSSVPAGRRVAVV